MILGVSQADIRADLWRSRSVGVTHCCLERSRYTGALSGLAGEELNENGTSVDSSELHVGDGSS